MKQARYLFFTGLLFFSEQLALFADRSSPALLACSMPQPSSSASRLLGLVPRPCSCPLTAMTCHCQWP